MYRRAVAPPFVEDRLHIDFSQNFFSALAELSQIVHDLPRASLKQAMARRRPRNIADVWRILAECGWDRESLFEPNDVELLRDRFDTLGLPYEKGERGSVWLADDVVKEHYGSLADLRVARIMRELFRKRHS
jgi:hypothetical protein